LISSIDKATNFALELTVGLYHTRLTSVALFVAQFYTLLIKFAQL